MYTQLSTFLWGAALGMALALAIFIAGIYYERLRKVREDKKIAAQLELERRLAVCETLLVRHGEIK